MTDYTEKTDDELIRLAQEQGDKNALAALHDKYRKKVISHLAKRYPEIIGPETAEDLYQDVYRDLHRNIKRYSRRRGTPKQWIYKIAYFKAVQYIRRVCTIARHNEKLANQTRAFDTNKDLTELELREHRELVVRRMRNGLYQRCLRILFEGGGLTEVADAFQMTREYASKFIGRAKQQYLLTEHALASKHTEATND